LPASLHVDGRYYDDVLMLRVREDAGGTVGDSSA
jgi:hypothetical protein